MQKYLIPKTLVAMCGNQNIGSHVIRTLLIMSNEYLNNKRLINDYPSQQLMSFFEPIRAEIDAANKKKKREKVLK